MISNGYNNPRIVRSPSLNMYNDIYSGGTKLIRGAEDVGKKYVLPALKTAGKETLKLTTKPLPTIGQGLGLTLGVGGAVLAQNPEIMPYLGGAGAFAGKKAGQWAEKEINKAIDKL
jgi:hypothetical protein